MTQDDRRGSEDRHPSAQPADPLSPFLSEAERRFRGIIRPEGGSYMHPFMLHPSMLGAYERALQAEMDQLDAITGWEINPEYRGGFEVEATFGDVGDDVLDALGLLPEGPRVLPDRKLVRAIDPGISPRSAPGWRGWRTARRWFRAALRAATRGSGSRW